MSDNRNSSQLVLADQVTITNVAAALPAIIARRFHVRALSSNTDDIAVGGNDISMTKGIILSPGDWFPNPVTVGDLSKVWAIANSGSQKLGYVGEV